MRVTVIPTDFTIICDGIAVKIKPWPFDGTLLEPYIEAFNNALNPPSEPS